MCFANFCWPWFFLFTLNMLLPEPRIRKSPGRKNWQGGAQRPSACLAGFCVLGSDRFWGQDGACCEEEWPAERRYRSMIMPLQRFLIEGKPGVIGLRPYCQTESWSANGAEGDRDTKGASPEGMQRSGTCSSPARRDHSGYWQPVPPLRTTLQKIEGLQSKGAIENSQARKESLLVIGLWTDF